MKESYKQKKNWENELKEMLENAGLKPIQFKMNNSGARILARIYSLIDETEKEAYERGAREATGIITMDDCWKQAQSEMREIIENMPTEFPERESDEYDRAYKDAKEYLLNKIK